MNFSNRNAVKHIARSGCKSLRARNWHRGVDQLVFERLEARILLTLAPVPFAPAVDYPAVSGGDSVAVGDVNLDGWVDFVVGNLHANNVSVRLGNGDATFDPNTDYSVGNLPRAVALHDLNHDNYPDIIANNFGDNTISVLMGNGDGTFGAKTDFALGINPWIQIGLGDLNGDGHVDLVEGDSSLNVMSILLGNGDGTFAAPELIPTPAQSLAITLGDLNGDSRLDVIAAGGGNALMVFLGDGDGTLGPAMSYSLPGAGYFLAVGNLDGDSRLDVVTANGTSDNVSVFLGNGDGTLSVRTDYAAGSIPHGIMLADLNNDSALDMFTNDSGSNTISVFLGNGDGTFTTRATVAVSARPMSVAAADFNNDGRLDLVVGNEAADTVSVLLNLSPAVIFAPPVDYFTGGFSHSLAEGVVNGDGRFDLAVVNGNENSVSILLGNGDGTFDSTADFGVGTLPYAVALRDLNHDGNLDIIANNVEDNSVSVLLGSGDGTFAVKQDFALGLRPWIQIGLGDLNGDTHVDVVNGSVNSGEVTVLLGNGDGTFASPTLFATPAAPHSVALADLNGDNILDVIAGGATLSVLLGIGDGTFDAAVPYSVPSYVYFIAVGDLNGDSNLDVVTANSTANNVSVLLGNGDGTFSSRVDYAAGSRPHGIMLADLNNDGNLDMVNSDAIDSTVSLYLGIGDGTFAPRTTFTVGDDPVIVEANDLNGDGMLDLAVANSASGTVSVLMNLPSGPTLDVSVADYSILETGVTMATVTRSNADGPFTDVIEVHFDSVEVPTPILDNLTITSSLMVGNVVGEIVDVDVNLDISHTSDSDLTIILIDPIGNQVVLTSNLGGNGDHFTATIFDDEAATDIDDGSAPFTGSFRPQQSLTAADGFSPNGTWQLEIYDGASGNEGTLNSWSLDFEVRTLGPLTVNVSSDDTTEVTMPATVVIPAGQLSTTFVTTGVDDGIHDGIQTASIFVSVFGYKGAGVHPGATALLNIIDRDHAIDLNGTGGDDIFDFTLSSTELVLTINGTPHSFDPALIYNLYPHGLGGNDHFTLTGSTGNETVVLHPGTIVLSGPGYQVDADGMEDNRVDAGGGGTDTASLYDSTANDTFNGHTTYSDLLGPGFYNRVTGFDSVNAYATAGSAGSPGDRSNFYDSVGNDTFTGRPTNSTLTGTGYSIYAESFDKVFAFATAGDAGGVGDRAYLYDSAGNDLFSGRPTYGVLSGTGFYNHAENFDKVYAYSTAGDAGGVGDRANLYDSTGNDTFNGQPTYGSLMGTGFYNYAENFDKIFAYATAGDAGGVGDRAYMYDSTGNDTFTGRPTFSVLAGTGFYNYAGSFDKVYAYANAGDAGGVRDRAYLFDSVGNDTFTGRPTYSTLAGTGYYNYAGSFDKVYGYATAGDAGGVGDRANLYDSAGNDTFIGRPTYGILSGVNFYNYAGSFDKVSAYATAGDAGGVGDQAYLYDSAGNDTFTGRSTFSSMVGTGYFNYAGSFNRVYAFATAGDAGGVGDRADLYDSTGDDLFYGRSNYGYLSGANFYNYVSSFDSVNAYATGGGTDTLDKDAVDYLFSSFGTWEIIL